MTATVVIERQGPVGLVTLNKPERHNAFDDALIGELTEALRSMEAEDAIRVVVLSGTGASFCAGADLDWMKRAAGYSKDENQRDAMAMGALLRTLDHLRKPTIARVHGNAFGGGVGLVACCDVAIAAYHAEFALTEVRLGLIPAVISPYVIAAIGAKATRRLALTGERIEAAEAYRLGLLHDLAGSEPELDEKIAGVVEQMLKGAPVAQREIKELVRAVANRPMHSEILQDTAERIARIRSSPEGREGLAAFLEKRKPSWHVEPPEPGEPTPE
jgi:methylglutaconyl-CoA hydratase